MMEWKNLYRGAIMGIVELIPGVSSGTIAIVLGIYDQLIIAINGIFSRDWKKHLSYLIPLGVGMGIGLLSFVRLINYLLDHHFEATSFFFLGLIIGVLPLLFKKADAGKTFTSNHIITLFIAAIIVASLNLLPQVDGGLIVSLTLFNGLGLFLSGWLASLFMLLPGISGSLILLILGVYYTATNALATFNIPIIIVIGSGVVFGFFVSSKLIKFLLKNHYHMTYAAIIGLVIGSVFVVYPGISSSLLLIPCIITFVAGAATAILLGSRG